MTTNRPPVYVRFLLANGAPAHTIKGHCENYLTYATALQHREGFTDEQKRRTLDQAEAALAWASVSMEDR